LRALEDKRAQKERDARRAEEQRTARAAHLAAFAQPVERDPSRLTRPTSAVLARAKAREEEEAAAADYAAKHGGQKDTALSRPVLGAKATAGWRAGL
jgi:hypothetical protein